MSKAKTMDKSYKFWNRVSRISKYVDDLDSPLDICLQSKFGIYLMPQDTILDFGCGTGNTTLQIARYASKVYGVDSSDGMLKKAELNMKEQNVENATFLPSTKLGEILQSNSCDVVTSFSVLQYIEDRRQLFDDFHKLLKPLGFLIISTAFLGEKKSFVSRLIRTLGILHIMPKTQFLLVKEFEREITDSGFEIVENINVSNLPEHFIVARKI